MKASIASILVVLVFLISELPIVELISCYQCHGTSVSAVTASCWENVDDEHARFVSTVECQGSCSIVVLNHTSIGLTDFTRSCESNCRNSCYDTPFGTRLCKYCCSSDRCNAVVPTHIPKTYSNATDVSTDNLKWWIEKHFSKPRHHAADPSHKFYTRHEITKLLSGFSLEVEQQEFEVSEVHAEDRAPLNFRSFIRTTTSGYNIIGVSPGSEYKTSEDKIIVVMAHYDTTPSGSPGFNDNGSGCTVLLELARLISSPKCTRSNTVVFVATDYKEQGIFRHEATRSSDCLSHANYVNKVGSSHFVCGWLIPHLREYGGEFRLTFNLDTLLNIEDDRATDPWPSEVQRNLKKLSPHGNRFLTSLKERSFSRNWWMVTLSTSAFQTLYEITTPGNNFDEDRFLYLQLNTTDETRKSQMSKFLNADDCTPFHESRSINLPCLTISDTGNLRGYMKQCHQKACDSVLKSDPRKIKNLAKVSEIVLRYIRALSAYSCIGEESSIEGDVNQEKSSDVQCRSPLVQKLPAEPGENWAGGVFVSATCARTGTIFEMCPSLTDGVWGIVNGNSAWIPRKMKLGRAPLWFQVDFGKIKNITSIAVQGVRRVGYVRSYMVSYSNNERQWEWHIPSRNQWTGSTRRAEIRGNTSSGKISKRALEPPISAKFVRIYPRWWRRRIALRVQMYGCDNN